MSVTHEDVHALSRVASPAENTSLSLAEPAEGGVKRFLGIPDVSSIDLSKLSAEDAATLALGLSKAINKASEAFNTLMAGVRTLQAEAQARVFTAIKESGGTALPHEYLRAELVTSKSYEANVATLRGLIGLIPKSEIGEGVSRRRVVIESNLDDAQIEQLRSMIGTDCVKEEWGTHAGVLNRLTKKYGENSPVGAIIAKGLRSVEGQPRLVIAELEGKPEPLTVVPSAAKASAA